MAINTYNTWFKRLLKQHLETPNLNLVQWADNHRILGRETSAEAGKWNTDRTPYMREIMLSISDKKISKVTIMSSAQVGKSELGCNFIGYTIDTDPRSMLVVLPTQEAAEMFSVERIEPMVKNTPRLKGKVADEKSRDKQNTKLKKSFEGGFLVFVGANAPTGLASRPVGVIILDEVDRFPISAGKEGDPVELALARTTTFFDRKIIMTSTPVLKGQSRIEQAYNEGSKAEWCLPCPECGEYQPLTIEKFDTKDLTMICEKCNIYSTEIKWKRNLLRGKWIHADLNNNDKSYHLNAFTSPWVSWQWIADQYVKSKNNGNEQLKTFYNLVLGLPYEDMISYADARKAYELRQDYTTIPDDIDAITCGVDVQGNRLEFDIKAWKPDKTNYGIWKGIIYGSPSEQNTWDKLSNYLNMDIKTDSGQIRHIDLTFIDSGGHHTYQVYRQCFRLTKISEYGKVVPIKGVGGGGIPFVDSSTDKIIGDLNIDGYKTMLVKIGVNAGKTQIMEINNPDDELLYRSYYPKKEIFGYDLEYFEQLFAERLVEKTRDGKTYKTWENIRKRNEALDCSVYALAAYLRYKGKEV